MIAPWLTTALERHPELFAELRLALESGRPGVLLINFDGRGEPADARYTKITSLRSRGAKPPSVSSEQAIHGHLPGRLPEQGAGSGSSA